MRYITICNKCETFFFYNREKTIVWSMIGFQEHANCKNFNLYLFGSLSEREEIIGFGVGTTSEECYEQLRKDRKIPDSAIIKINFVYLPSIIVWTPP